MTPGSTAPGASLPANRAPSRGWVGMILFLVVGALLLLLGERGRREIRLQLRVEELAATRASVFRLWDDPQAGIQTLTARPSLGRDVSAGLWPTKLNPGSLVSDLKAALGRFDADFAGQSLPLSLDSEVRVCRATVSIAERRFADALASLPETAEAPSPRDGSGPAGDVRWDALRLRGDAYFGQGSWREAWERYRQLPSRLPGYATAMIRAGACLELLTRGGEAVVTYEVLASDFHRQGDEAMENGKAAVALVHHQAARRIRAWLVERGQQQASEPGLAASHARCGDAALLDGQVVLAKESYLRAAELLERRVSRGDEAGLDYAFAVARANLGNVALVAGDPEAALQWYGKAIEGLDPMSKAAGRPGLRTQLARASFNRGNALLGLQRLDAAIQDFTVAITLQAGEPDELALSFNNRGVARRARGDVNGAATDFEAALTALQSSMPSKSVPAESPAPERIATHLEPRLRLDVVVGFSENAIEVLTRPRSAVRSSENERAVAVAVAARNRAYAALVQGQAEVALPHFENSANTYSGLVGREGQRDLTPQLAASFASLAWFLATQPDGSLRRGARAREYAWQACELSEWKDFAPLDALAAACAETGDFAGAAKWQAKATDSAPAARKPELYARLRLYQSGTPYRAPKPRL